MTFNIYTLGCKVNTYESNVMIDKLTNVGYKQVPTDEAADISIINTCTVTNTADSKSLKTIRHVARNNENAIIVVTGCFAQNKKDIFDNMDEVAIALGNVGKADIVSYIKKYMETHKKNIDIKDVMHTDFESMKLNNFNRTRAFVKIEDGCENFCTYCIIPYTRGSVRSKKRNDVIDEVSALVKDGHSEVVLTGIHTGHYGADLDNYNFAALLRELVNIEGLKRLRISSIEMNELSSEVLNVIKESPIIVDHLHIPLQSGSDRILKSMNRKYNIDEFENKINEIRSIRPNISITTDVIVGFPGESEEDFEEMKQNICKINFSKLHVFPYSKREGTKDAEMPNQIKENEKKTRVRELINLSKELETNYMNKFLNKEIIYIPEIYKDGYIVGHTGNYLLIKEKGTKEDLYKEKTGIIKEINYPYCIL